MSTADELTMRPAWKTALSDNAVVIHAFVGSRAALLMVGLLTQIFIRPITTQGNELWLSPHQALNIWGAWDTGWYVDLALHGYQHGAGADGQANWAFFPAFPALAAMIARTTGFPPFAAMLLISNVSFLVALGLLHRIARAEFDRKTADIAVALLSVAPGSYIFSAGYSEALFLLCVCAGLLAIRARRWVAAGAIAAVAALTRNLGVGLLLPYAWVGLEQLLSTFKDDPDRRPGPRQRLELLARLVIGGLLPLAALGGFALHLQSRTGDALAFVHVQTAWARDLAAPFSRFAAAPLHPSTIQDGDLISFAAAWFAIAMLVVLASMRRWPLLLLALFMTLVPLSTGLLSFARLALVIAPIWIALAKLLSTRPVGTVTTIAMFSVLNGFMMVAWTLALRVAA